MNHNQNHENGRRAGPQLVPVRFEFTDPTATTVSVVGTFSDWRCKTKSMIPLGSGHWLKRMVLAPGTYEYCLVVDGKCMPDPLTKETVPNSFGGRNSILKVVSLPEAAPLADAAHLPLKTQPNRKHGDYEQRNTSNQP